jgi:branched-chain amino acid aminotransferase
MNGEIIETDKALVSAMEPIHLGIYEGIKAYVEGNNLLGEGRLAIFGWKPHLDRLWLSAKVDGLKISYTGEKLLEAVRELVRINEYKTNVYIQPRVWPKANQESESHFVIPIWKFETMLGNRNPKFAKKRRLIVSSWRRIASDALPPQAKSWGNYANTRLGVNEAKRLGYDGPIFLDARGFVSESSVASIMSVRDGTVVTPPVSAAILESVTRRAFLQFIPEDLGIPVEVRDLTRVELYASDEVFLCGTNMEATPVTSIDDIEIGDQYPGPITTQIAQYYSDIVAGNVKKRKNWLTPISE